MIVAQREPSGFKMAPVLQFFLLLWPIVFTCFYFIYALLGLVVSGDDLLYWKAESRNVAGIMAPGILAFVGLCLAYVAWRRLGLHHPVAVSSLLHGIICIALTALIFAYS